MEKIFTDQVIAFLSIGIWPALLTTAVSLIAFWATKKFNDMQLMFKDQELKFLMYEKRMEVYRNLHNLLTIHSVLINCA